MTQGKADRVDHTDARALGNKLFEELRRWSDDPNLRQHVDRGRDTNRAQLVVTLAVAHASGRLRAYLGRDRETRARNRLVNEWMNVESAAYLAEFRATENAGRAAPLA